MNGFEPIIIEMFESARTQASIETINNMKEKVFVSKKNIFKADTV